MITVEHLNHEFTEERSSQPLVLQDVSLTVAEGEVLAIVGPSGCGKTTLLNIVAGLEEHHGTGTVKVGGEDPRPGRYDVGYMLARDSLLPWRNTLENACLALEIQGVPKSERHQRAHGVLRAVGLERFQDKYPAQLSQGMRQRVALARVFAGEPDLLLLDEPFSALDAQTRVLVQDAFLLVWERRKTTVVLVTHDLGEAVALADRVVLLTHRPGRIKATYDIPLSRPRSAFDVRGSADFQHIYEVIWNDLKGEVIQAQVSENVPEISNVEVERTTWWNKALHR